MQVQRHLVALLLVGAASAMIPSNSRGEGWSIGIAGGYADPHRVLTTKTSYGRYPIGADGTAIASVQVLRSVGRHFSISSQATYLPYGVDADLNRAQSVPIGIGVRYTPLSPAERGAWPYLELSPALVFSRWRVGSYGDTRESSLRPGLTGGFGVHGRIVGDVGMEVGVRYFLSTDKRRDVRPGVTQTFEGLGQTAILAGLFYNL